MPVFFSGHKNVPLSKGREGETGGRGRKKRPHLAHAAVNNEIHAVDEAALIAGQEDNGVRLLNRLAEAAGRHVHQAPLPLGLVVAQPVLQQWRAV